MTDDVPKTCRQSPRQPSHRTPTTRPRGTPQRCTEASSSNTRRLPAGDRARPRTTGPVAGLDYIDVTVIDLAHHTAYLEPFTGTGFLVLPPGMSESVFGWDDALTELDELGWFLLDDQSGQVETAGRTTDDRVVVCLYADTAIIDDPSQADICRALTALGIAARLQRRAP